MRLGAKLTRVVRVLSSEPTICLDPPVQQMLTAYCFGRASDVQKQAVESHLQVCQVCLSEAARLRAAVTVIESDQSLLAGVDAEQIAGTFGMSGLWSRVWGGHWQLVLWGGALYGLAFMALLFLEIAYRFDLYGKMAIGLALPVWLWMWGTTALALWGVWQFMLRERAGSLLIGVLALIISAALLFILLCQFLPAHSITAASFKTYTAQGAYLKGIIWILPSGLIFLLWPYQFILTLQRELRLRQHASILGLLTGDKQSVTPRGTIYPRIWFLIFILLVISVSVVPGASNILENLTNSPYQNLFTLCYLARWGLQFAFGLSGIVWFVRALNEVKRECLIVARFKQVNQLS